MQPQNCCIACWPDIFAQARCARSSIACCSSQWPLRMALTVTVRPLVNAGDKQRQCSQDDVHYLLPCRRRHYRTANLACL